MEKLDFIDSKFRLAILAAKRAKQLVGGSKKKIDTDAENPLTIALEEIYRGKIDFEIFEEEANIIEENERFHLSLDESAEEDDSFEIDEDSAEEFLFRKDDEDNEEEAS